VKKATETVCASTGIDAPLNEYFILHEGAANKTSTTIVSGVVRYLSCDMLINTESGASSDDLDTIAPIALAQSGDVLILHAADDAKTVVVKNGTGNIVCNGDFSLDGINDRIVLQWDAPTSKWVEITRNDDIPYSALSALTSAHILVGNSSNVPTDVAMSGDITIDNAGVTSIGSGWTSFAGSISFTGSGSMTISSVSVSIAEYCQIGKVVFWQVYATMTTGGTASNSIRHTLPIAPANDADNKIGNGCWVIDSTAEGGLYGWSGGGDYIQVFKATPANFGLGASRAVNTMGFYKVA